MQYEVIALNVGGLRNRIFKRGAIVSDKDFIRGTAEKLCTAGFLKAIHTNIKPTPLDGDIRVAIVTAVWKRPEIFELFARGIHELKRGIGAEIPVIVAGSEGTKSRKMVEAHGFTYIEVPNDPLATKVNAPMLIAKDAKVDYVLCMGSDDIITPELFKVYEEYMRQGYDFIGVLDWYFYDTVSRKAAYWGGYRDERRKGHTCGAGRLLSVRILNLWNWQPWEIKDSKVLDNSMQNKLKTTPHSIATFTLKEKNVLALDIKSSTNMTPFQLWDNTSYINADVIKNKFPYVCAG